MHEPDLNSFVTVDDKIKNILYLCGGVDGDEKINIY